MTKMTIKTKKKIKDKGNEVKRGTLGVCVGFKSTDSGEYVVAKFPEINDLMICSKGDIIFSK